MTTAGKYITRTPIPIRSIISQSIVSENWRFPIRVPERKSHDPKKVRTQATNIKINLTIGIEDEFSNIHK